MVKYKSYNLESVCTDVVCKEIQKIYSNAILILGEGFKRGDGNAFSSVRVTKVIHQKRVFVPLPGEGDNNITENAFCPPPHK